MSIEPVYVEEMLGSADGIIEKLNNILTSINKFHICIIFIFIYKHYALLVIE